MDTVNLPGPQKNRPIFHSYIPMPGVQVDLEGMPAQEYATMRARQLSALMHVISLANDCEHSTMSDKLRGDVHWLACTMADELVELMGVVADDAELRGTMREESAQ